jgi:beta-lactamase regulating signal transducer with metallopeptidase domain
MNSLVSFFSSPTAEVITRTLLHTFWQSAGILVILLFVLRITPERNSKARYLFAYASIILLLVTSGYTFVEGWQKSGEMENAVKREIALETAVVVQEAPASATTLLDQLNTLISACTPYVVILWIFGVCLFLFRLSGSWWCLYSIRKNVTLYSGELADELNKVASRLNIRRTVLLAESASVHVPLVIGYLKPMLLIPIGFVSGLSTQQVEAIFIHELTHIKREDYLLNLIQSVAEAIFFFNPFVWIISSIIRREREHCCDDAVLRSGGNAIAYVRALAHLEEHRVAQPTLALSAIGTKNQLLNRIKRIMENSAVKNSLSEKIIPAMLLVIGIVCASWVTISTKDHIKSSDNINNLAKTDTTIRKKNSRSATSSRKRILTTPPGAEPHEDVVENFVGDEDMRSMVAVMDFPDHFPLPDMPAFDVILPPHFEGFAFYSDSLPRKLKSNAEQWKEFQQQFQVKFKAEFGDFYLKNQNEFNKMLNEMEPEFNARFNEEFDFGMEHIAHIQEGNMELQEKQLRLAELAIQDQEEHMREMEVHLKKWDREHAVEMKKLEEGMKAMEQNMKGFEKELKENLRKDGYLKETESLRHMHWKDNGDIEINDIRIKPAHAKKYRELHSRYFDHEPQGFRYEE